MRARLAVYTHYLIRMARPLSKVDEWSPPVVPSVRPSTHELVTRVRTTGRPLLFAVVEGKKEERGPATPNADGSEEVVVGGTLRSLRFLSAQHVARQKPGVASGDKKAVAARGRIDRMGSAPRAISGWSGVEPARAALLLAAPRERMALAVAAPAPAGRCRACPEKVCCSPVVAWPSTLTKPRCAGIGRPNHNQPLPTGAPTPSNHSRDLWPPGDLFLLLTRTILSTEEPLRHFLLHQFLSHFLPSPISSQDIYVYISWGISVRLCNTAPEFTQPRAKGRKDENIAPEHMNSLGLLVLIIFQRPIRRDRIGLQSPWPPNTIKVVFGSHICYVNGNR